jgi:hypothetical protein
MTYTCTYDLSFRPHLLIKKESKDLDFLSRAQLTDFDSGITEFYMESNTIENIIDALSLYGFDSSIGKHIAILESFFLATQQKYNRLYSFHTQGNEFSMYFRVVDLNIIVNLLKTLFPEYSGII